MLTIFDIAHINNWSPCYQPDTKLPSNWTGTIIDLLNASEISFSDKVWAACRNEFLDNSSIRSILNELVEGIECTDTRSLECIQQLADYESLSQEAKVSYLRQAWAVVEQLPEDSTAMVAARAMALNAHIAIIGTVPLVQDLVDKQSILDSLINKIEVNNA